MCHYIFKNITRINSIGYFTSASPEFNAINAAPNYCQVVKHAVNITIVNNLEEILHR